MDKVELKDETAILPNPCYMKCRLIYDKAQLKH